VSVTSIPQSPGLYQPPPEIAPIADECARCGASVPLPSDAERLAAQLERAGG
jgi:hypothetical protein